ncbi:exodeoxyribonuclease VII small subunit [Candidatus Oleimmundimicrobium sp.]|uniref:exodeoxyribonuclease VII small subunit n=1 Tax=Candidatus Oleimmundimicrobium sp. TaxID=3060597 RepID=UPI00271BDEBF|nr:exodeoxyribonuclease VII small subunit [Candidatus Oleimmundimicrobium sp.]MDO8886520.1 exodeoxyribonuclease VII small subunit [Candidatus Oleimmundimicrobium sp.]
MGENKEKNFGELMDRLNEIVDLVQQKDINLEKSLDLLEEGIELANKCTEKVDQFNVENMVQLKEEGV